MFYCEKYYKIVASVRKKTIFKGDVKDSNNVNNGAQ
jgi:hypothetical protein